MSLEEIRDLVSVWDGGQCASVKARLTELIADRGRDVAGHIEELTAFDAELIRARGALAAPAPPGAFDENCGCSDVSSAPVILGLSRRRGGSRHAEAAEVPIACTLSSDAPQNQLEEWTQVLAASCGRATIRRGVRFTFDNDAQLVGRLSRSASSSAARSSHSS